MAGTNVLLAVLTAATVVTSMRVVGLLLISALMIVPNAVAQQVAGSFRANLTIAVVVGVSVSVLGTAGSHYANTPPGGDHVDYFHDDHRNFHDGHRHAIHGAHDDVH